MAPAETALTVPYTTNSLAHSTKGTQSPRGAPTPWKYIISRLFHSPSRGTFHLSFTVLVRYRSDVFFSLGRWSSRIQSGFHVSEPTQDTLTIINLFHVRGYHPILLLFPKHSAIKILQISESYNPRHKCLVWAFPSSLVATKGISIDFFYPATEIFQFADFPPCS